MTYVFDYGEDRIGMSGVYAKQGDIVEVVRGRKFPIGMKMAVVGHDAFCKYQTPDCRFQAFGDDQIVFYGEGFRKETINADNVEIIAIKEDRSWNPEYRNVHTVEVLI